MDYSQDTIEIFIDIIEMADAGEDIEVCAVNSVTLNASLPVTGEGMWTQPMSQAGVGVEIVDPSDPQTSVEGLVPGNTYIFSWVLADNGCGESIDEIEVFVADAEAFAGIDFFECGDGCTFLAASEPAVALGAWSSPDPNIIFEDILDNQSEVCNLVPGINTFIWTLNEGECGDDGIDTVFVEYKYAPTAVQDDIVVSFAGVVDFDVSANDDIPADFFIEVLTQPEHGTLIEGDDGRFTYQADINYIGTDEFLYQICSESCECSEALVVLTVGREAECIIPNIITPNEDGVNDRFVIPCLAETQKFLDNEVAIFNVWGDEIFRAAPYLNDWEGMYNGEELPAGTYFYVVNFGDGTEVQSGFLVLHR
jgi:gliding motility-associated-like protein